MSTPATPRPTLADCPCLRPARDDLPPTWAGRNEVPAPPPGRVWLYGPGSRPIASALLDCPCRGTGKIEPGKAPTPDLTLDFGRPPGPAAAAQPAPVPSRHRPTWQVVIARAKARRDQHEDGASWSLWYRLVCDMIDRDQVGRERYGVPLGPWNGRDSLTDLYQEVLDGCCYAANHAIEHPDDIRARMMADEMMQLSLRVRAMIDEREGR